MIHKILNKMICYLKPYFSQFGWSSGAPSPASGQMFWRIIPFCIVKLKINEKCVKKPLVLLNTSHLTWMLGEGPPWQWHNHHTSDPSQRLKQNFRILDCWMTKPNNDRSLSQFFVWLILVESGTLYYNWLVWKCTSAGYTLTLMQI